SSHVPREDRSEAEARSSHVPREDRSEAEARSSHVPREDRSESVSSMHADFPLPDTEWEPTREFWAGAARHELLIPRCNACGAYTWYPRERCRTCRGEAFTWTVMSGRGRLFSWAVVTRAFLPQLAGKVPLVPALVALDEDPVVRLVTEIVDCEPDDLRFDMPVRVVYRPLEFEGIGARVTPPMFTIAT